MTMYTAVEYGVNSVPAFLTKVWTLVEDPETDELISWDPSGLSFHVHDQGRFAKEILPHYFKHRNMASFVRQLNMYGFRKVVHIDSAAIKSQSDDVEFHHPYFVKGQENLLEHIKRKTSQVSGTTNTMKTEAGLKFSHDDVTRVLKDVQQMKGKQEAFTMKMDKMKKENEALWREVASLRQKHVKQQQIVNKLIQFMIHLVGGNRNPLSGSAMPKRKIPLMISDSSQVSPAKRPRFNKQLSIEEMTDPEFNYIITSPGSHGDDSSDKVSYTKGPIIHEVTDSVPSLPVQSTSKTQSIPPTVKEIADIKSPSKTPSELLLPADTFQDLTADLNTDLNSSITSTDLTDLVEDIDKSLLGVPNSDGTSTNITGYGTVGVLDKNQLSNQLDTLQFEIDSLKDMMTGEQFNFDPTTVLPLFNVDGTVPVSIENLLGELDTQSLQSTPSMPPANTGNIVGNELVQFQPPADTGILDLSDLVNLDTPIAPTEEHEEEAEPIDPMSFINTVPMSTADDLQ